jgi:hypothetical protein
MSWQSRVFPALLLNGETMLIYKLQPRFNQLTGAPAKSVLTLDGWLCDFCGTRHNPMEEDLAGNYSFVVHETGDIEPQFHELRVEGFPEIDIYSVFNEHPHFQFCMNWDTLPQHSCERDLLVQYMKGRKKSEMSSVCDMFYSARLAMLAKLLADKTYTIEELKLEKR